MASIHPWGSVAVRGRGFPDHTNKAWDGLTPDLQRILEVSLRKAALSLAIQTEIRDKKVAVELAGKGVTLHDWSVEDRKAFRQFARDNWQRWAEKSEAAGKLVASHIEYMKGLGLVD